MITHVSESFEPLDLYRIYIGWYLLTKFQPILMALSDRGNGLYSPVDAPELGGKTQPQLKWLILNMINLIYYSIQTETQNRT